MIIKNISAFIICLCILVAAGCGASEKATTSDSIRQLETTDEINPALDLADHLKRLPGVSVVGSGLNTIVTLRGFKSISGDSEPLYVIDGRPVQGGYAAASSQVAINDIESIRVLRDVNERAKYGFRAQNGVIEISTKKAQ